MQDQMQELPKKTLTEAQACLLTELAVVTKCTVCLMEEPAVGLRLPCGHQYHKHCIRKWLCEMSVKCPICRASVEDAVLDESDLDENDFSVDSLEESLERWLETQNMEEELAELQAGAKIMTKDALAAALAKEHGLSKARCSKMLDSLAAIAKESIKGAGKFVMPGICHIKAQRKPPCEQKRKFCFGKAIDVKAKPARTVVKASPVAAWKKRI
eukprot:12431487-Karenia_brevis.AAC.1